MAKHQLVLSIFPDELAADDAAVAVKESGVATGDAIGIMALDSAGKLKTDKVGAHSVGKGATIGAALTLLGPAGIAAGVVGGAAVGALHHKNLGLSDSDKASLTSDLQSGKAAVGVLSSYETASAVSRRLTELGGSSHAHNVDDAAMEAPAV